ncbi:PspC domain-containing protein [Thermococcus radiotolerans]|uniref:Transcriptional regulator n=1 Tax=Thermococcus radiotolerans TaxID=187880 RepID=A0A2Z2N1J6_9EURY|nr:PspC domain-containing protein [Thermococcus radiotolerans]ASJ14847.1 transcriptional regulator [Thermococcus radiotolerans]
MARKLTRSRKDRILLGVLGGIAEHLDVDPTLVRIIFAVLFVSNPVAMGLLYFIVALIIPEEGEEGEEKPLGDKITELVDETGERLGEVFSGSENSKALAIVLIILGAILLAGPFFPLVMPVVDPKTALAVVFLVIGIILLVKGD